MDEKSQNLEFNFHPSLPNALLEDSVAFCVCDFVVTLNGWIEECEPIRYRSVALPTIYIIEVDKSVLIRLEQLDEDEERSFHHHAYTTPFEDRYSK